MNRSLKIFAAVLATAVLAACEAPPHAIQQVQKVAAPVAEIASWPPPASANLPVAPDLLADNYLFVLDDSGSMGDGSCGGGKSRIEAAQEGAIKFSKGVPAKANLGLVILNGRERIELGTGNRNQFEKLIRDTGAGGNTPLKRTIGTGLDMLTVQAQKQRGYGTYHLVVVTDGESTDGNPGPLAKSIVAKTAINLHVIGFCADEKHSLYLPGYTKYTSALNPQALNQGLKQVLAESETYKDSPFAKQ